LAVSEALKFRELLGEKRIRDYTHNLAVNVGKTISEIWGTEMLVSDEKMIGTMVNVRIPFEGELDKLMMEIYEKYNTFLMITKFSNGKFYARFSCQIFNELGDYVTAARALTEYCMTRPDTKKTN